MRSVADPVQDLSAAYRQVEARLRAYVRRRVSDDIAAEDLVHDVFVKAARAYAEGRAPTSPVAWLYTAARTAVIDHYRRRPRQQVELGEDLVELEQVDDQLHRDLARCIAPLLDRLPPIYRDTLQATDISGETMTSLARRQGVSVSAIKSRASRARKLLKDSLLRCCEVRVERGTIQDAVGRGSKDCGSC